MTDNNESIQESLKIIYNQLNELSKKTGIKTKELIQIMANRELVIINNQLHAIHEHLDKISKQTDVDNKTKN
ncbi:MAG: hypothetical protein QCH99_00455 [Candidatus Bathyarchaeota archaeon]|nr:hypothetical protein [Candidatus Bathyarchaeum tardum]WGM89467.1 MAG: hypothetical protein NUK63_11300 [Candidatus Bathyarchaeum tardum]